MCAFAATQHGTSTEESLSHSFSSCLHVALHMCSTASNSVCLGTTLRKQTSDHCTHIDSIDKCVGSSSLTISMAANKTPHHRIQEQSSVSLLLLLALTGVASSSEDPSDVPLDVSAASEAEVSSSEEPSEVTSSSESESTTAASSLWPLHT